MASTKKWYSSINSPASQIRDEHFSGVPPFGKKYNDVLKKLNLFQNSIKLSSALKKNTSKARINKDIFNADSRTLECIKEVIKANNIDIKFLNEITYLVTSFQNKYIHRFLNKTNNTKRQEYESELLKIIEGLNNNKKFDVSKILLSLPTQEIEIQNPIILTIVTKLLQNELPKLSSDKIRLTSKKITDIELDFAINTMHFLIANEIIKADLANLKRDLIKKSNFVLIQQLVECSQIPFIEIKTDEKKFPVYINKQKSIYWEAIKKAFERHFTKNGNLEALTLRSGWAI